MWPHATKCGSLRAVSKFRKVPHCNKHCFLHIVMQKWLLNDIPIKSYKMLNIATYDIIPNSFTEIWTLKDCNCTFMDQSRWKCSTMGLSFQNFILISVCHDCVWYDEYLWTIYQKWKILKLGYIFAHNLKSVLLQRASFSHAGTHFSTHANLAFFEERKVLHSWIYSTI